jgi:hypothetical protein
MRLSPTRPGWPRNTEHRRPLAQGIMSIMHHYGTPIRSCLAGAARHRRTWRPGAIEQWHACQWPGDSFKGMLAVHGQSGVRPSTRRCTASLISPKYVQQRR